MLGLQRKMDHGQKVKKKTFLYTAYARIYIRRIQRNKKNFIRNGMHPVGFEPTPPERIELESTALDHSATDAKIYAL